MNALELLRQMHADTRVRFKVILGTQDAAAALAEWRALRPLLALHEQLEDEFVYTPAAEETGPGTPLGDWLMQHDAEVAVVEGFIAAVDEADPASPEWRMHVGRVMDALSRHVMDEEGQIFGRIEQLWGPERLASVGAAMQHAMHAEDPNTPQGGRTREKTVARPRGR